MKKQLRECYMCGHMWVSLIDYDTCYLVCGHIWPWTGEIYSENCPECEAKETVNILE